MKKSQVTAKPSAIKKGKEEKIKLVKDVVVRDEKGHQLARVSKKKKEKGTSMRSLAPIGVESAPARSSSLYQCYYDTKMTKSGQISRGMDFLCQVKSRSESTVSGEVMLLNGGTDPHGLILTPLSDVFQGTKLGIDALKYEKFRFRRLKFIYTGDVGSSVAGSIILAYEPDAADLINLSPTAGASSLEAMQTALGFQDSLKGPGWSTFELNCKSVVSDPQKFYYTNYVGGDIRLAAQGQLWIINGGNQTVGTQYGTVLIEYECEFFDSSLTSINSQRYIVKNNFAVSTAANHGLNFLSSTLDLDQRTGEGDQYAIQVDESGNSFVTIPPGIHQLNYSSSCASGGTPTAASQAFSVLQNILNNGLSAVYTQLQYNASSAASTSSYNEIGRIDSPPGGCKLYSTLATTGSVVSHVLKLAQWAADTLI